MGARGPRTIHRCKGRIRYATQALADYACNEIDKNSREGWRGIEPQCADCDGWHLGPSKAVREKIRSGLRAHHEDQCAGVHLRQKRSGPDGIMWFQCTGCGWTFNEMTEGAAALVRRSGGIPVSVGAES